MDEIAKGRIGLADDVGVAHALVQLVHDDLRLYGTDSTNTLDQR